MIKTKRVYDKRVYNKPGPEDGLRILIMRRPMLVNKAFKEFLTTEGRKRWKKELSPSNELLDAYRNNLINWSEFKSRFIKEMYNQVSIASMKELGETMNVTLLCQEHEGENCHRHIVRELDGAYIHA